MKRVGSCEETNPARVKQSQGVSWQGEGQERAYRKPSQAYHSGACRGGAGTCSGLSLDPISSSGYIPDGHTLAELEMITILEFL